MSTLQTHRQELQSGDRFAFGENWAKYLAVIDEDRIRQAEQSLREMLETESLTNRRFLDIGSGSGLFSLAARRLGAKVHSFDYDPQSVACTQELKRRFLPVDPDWTIEQGSVLDSCFLDTLGQWDIVYSWGVLHHTGAMWDALRNVSMLVSENGLLFIALYNDQGRWSSWWLATKRLYNALPVSLRPLVLIPCFMRLWGPRLLIDAFRGNPLATWNGHRRLRGMSPWRDVIDWVGGLPFEVSTPEAVFSFFRARGYRLQRLRTCGGGRGCNEFVFQKASPDP
jgi:SAM-dependent methyltransferase